MRWLVVVLVVVGCYSPRSTRCEPCSGIAECPGGLACLSGTCQEALGACLANDDAGTELMPPDASAVCLGVQQRPFVVICPATEPVGTTALPARIDTKTDCTFVEPADVSTGKPELCVIAAATITVPGRTQVVGPRPLVLFARARVLINTTGHLLLHGANNDPDSPANLPAGANGCASPAGSNNTGPAGGGPGGTFQGRGGRGAAGDGVSATDAPPAISTALAIRGGCRGGDGGVSGASSPAVGLGGNGGGAVYLLAPSIQIEGVINASGGGARAAPDPEVGGGGGGSGGMILMWSQDPIVVGANAQIFALGGGGGPGAGVGASPAGDDPDGPTAPATATTGSGGQGGAGSTITNLDGSSGISATAAGGGGGGGASGVIKSLPKLESMVQIAPDPI